MNMLRTIINDDETWRAILRGLNKTFYHQTVTYDDIVNYICEKSGKKLQTVFDQYLHYKNIPILEFMVIHNQLMCRWQADAKGFNMPVRVRAKGGDYQVITPGTSFSPVKAEGLTKDNIEVDTFNYYIGVLVD